MSEPSNPLTRVVVCEANDSLVKNRSNLRPSLPPMRVAPVPSEVSLLKKVLA